MPCTKSQIPSFQKIDRQPCGNASRLRYSDSNPRGQSRACFGIKVYPNTAHTHHLHIVCGRFHAPVAETMLQWQKAAMFTIWPFIQRFPHPDNTFFSLATPWPPANPMDQSGFAVSLDLNSWVVLVASPHSQFLWSWLKSPLK